MSEEVGGGLESAGEKVGENLGENLGGEKAGGKEGENLDGSFFAIFGEESATSMEISHQQVIFNSRYSNLPWQGRY